MGLSKNCLRIKNLSIVWNLSLTTQQQKCCTSSEHIVCTVNSVVKSKVIKSVSQVDIRNRKVKPITIENVPYTVSNLHFISTGFLQLPLVFSLLLDKLSSPKRYYARNRSLSRQTWFQSIFCVWKCSLQNVTQFYQMIDSLWPG